MPFFYFSLSSFCNKVAREAHTNTLLYASKCRETGKILDILSYNTNSYVSYYRFPFTRAFNNVFSCCSCIAPRNAARVTATADDDDDDDDVDGVSCLCSCSSTSSSFGSIAMSFRSLLFICRAVVNRSATSLHLWWMKLEYVYCTLSFWLESECRNTTGKKKH